MSMLSTLRRPVVAAPMAGGPSTPRLAAAVSAAGGLGFLAAGMLTPDRMAAEIRQVRDLTREPFGINLFLPGDRSVDPDDIQAYASRLAPEARRWGVPLGEPAGGDDDYPGKLAALLSDPVPVVSFAFGLPDRRTVRALHDRRSEVWATVNHPEAAGIAADLGVDAVVVQGTEAGGHRGGSADGDDYGLLPLLRLTAGRCTVPLVAAGGVTDGAALAAVLAAGASAAQVGTAFLRCPEAGTLPAHRAAVASAADTALTRAFTGRRARAVVNDFLQRYDTGAPRAYPHVLNLVRPVLAAARAAGDSATVNHWAGQSHPLARDLPAARIVEELCREARLALTAAADRAAGWA
ncbi:MAG TPA: nitronate monooxygenase [Micromonosporaceae bacterium]|nr:nitronate monooxygenase [Micromonosporaceae bacterium]